MPSLVVGVLALQGAFRKHAEMLRSLHAIPKLVRNPKDLEECDALIVPGGESTTITKQIEFIKLKKPILEFAKRKPLFGTCAGLILMSNDCSDSSIDTWNLLNISVDRNGYGRQYDSFSADITVELNDKNIPFHAVFIRAPKITSAGKDVVVLARFQGEPVLVRQGMHFAAAFHPELTTNSTIHAHFLRSCSKSQQK